MRTGPPYLAFALAFVGCECYPYDDLESRGSGGGSIGYASAEAVRLRPARIVVKDDAVFKIGRDRMIGLSAREGAIELGNFSTDLGFEGALTEISEQCLTDHTHDELPCGCGVKGNLTEREQGLSNFVCMVAVTPDSLPRPAHYPSAPSVASFSEVIAELFSRPRDVRLMDPSVTAPAVADAVMPYLPMTLDVLIGNLEAWVGEVGVVENVTAGSYTPDSVDVWARLTDLEGSAFHREEGKWDDVIDRTTRVLHMSLVPEPPKSPDVLTLHDLEISIKPEKLDGLGEAVALTIADLAGCDKSAMASSGPTLQQGASFELRRVDRRGRSCHLDTTPPPSAFAQLIPEFGKFFAVHPIPETFSEFLSRILVDGLPFPGVDPVVILPSVEIPLDYADIIDKVVNRINSDESLSRLIHPAQPSPFDFFFHVVQGDHGDEEYLLVGAPQMTASACRRR